MKLKLSHLKEIKTTVIGLLCIALAIGGNFLIEDFNVWIFGISLGVGIIMLFSPDTLIIGLSKFIKANDEAKILDQETCSHDTDDLSEKDDLAQ